MCDGFDRRFARNCVEQCCAQTVNVAAEVLGVVVQSFRRDIFRGSPNDTDSPTLRCAAGKTKVADFCCVFIDKQNISRLHITVNQASPLRSTQSPCNLDANLEHSLFWQPRLQRHEIVEASLIDQFHYHIELAVIRSRIEYLYHIRMIHGGGNARLFLQSSFMILLTAEISAQQLQRHEPIQLHIARLINGAHPANAKRLNHDEMIEGSLHAYFLATRWTGDPRQWLRLCRIDSRPATGACLGGRLTRHCAPNVTFAALGAMK